MRATSPAGAPFHRELVARLTVSELPLIVCADLDADTQAVLDELRRRHFPPGRSSLGAHLTLFHQFPGSEADAAASLHAVTATTPPLTARITAPRNLGRGVALSVECPGLVALRQRLGEPHADALTAQDRQWRRPHVTVSNKTTPEAARALLAQLKATWEPRPATVVGLSLWRYLGGPWEAAGAWSFVTDPAHLSPPGA